MATKMNYGATATIFQYAEKLRNNMTNEEKMIWERCCRNQLGVRIRRQHPIWKYVADFYCHEVKLVSEIDGGIHLKKEYREYDIAREVNLNEFGIDIIRFANDEVRESVEAVVQAKKERIEKLKLMQSQIRNKPPLGDLGAGAERSIEAKMVQEHSGGSLAGQKK